MTAAERFLEALQAAGCPVRRSGRGLSARCPAHEDRSPSLSVTPIEGMVLIHCHAGCDPDAVLEALHLTRRDLFDSPAGATYRYESGRCVYRSPNKDFRQSGDTSRFELYRLTKVKQCVTTGAVVHLVEGEKDVHALEALGAVATTAPADWQNIEKVDVSPLKGARVIAVVDRDATGAKWAAIVRKRLQGYAAELTLVEAKQGKDAADHVASGHDLDDFADYVPAGEAPAEAEERELRERAAVKAEADRLRVLRKARRLVDAEEAASVEVPPFDAGATRRDPRPAR
jgi:DNA primase